jgi:hypothetical protein
LGTKEPGGKMMETDADRLKQRYNAMATDALIELQRMGKQDLTESAWVVLGEVLKSRGVTAETGVASTEPLEQPKPRSTDKNWYTRKRFFWLSLSGLLSILFVYSAGHVILNNIGEQPKTNRTYLKELIENGYIEKAAVASLSQLIRTRTGNVNIDIGGNSISEVEWKKIEKRFSECAAREAHNYLISDDPYLNAQANKDTPGIFSERFFKPCVASIPNAYWR